MSCSTQFRQFHKLISRNIFMKPTFCDSRYTVQSCTLYSDSIWFVLSRQPIVTSEYLHIHKKFHKSWLLQMLKKEKMVEFADKIRKKKLGKKSFSVVKCEIILHISYSVVIFFSVLRYEDFTRISKTQ